MFQISESRIEELLDVIADEQFNFQNLYEDIKKEQPELFSYMNTQDVSFFTREERAYYEFVVQFLWFIKIEEKHQVNQLEKDSMTSREDAIWGMINEKFSMEHILSSLDLCNELSDLILDLMDEETSGKITEVGREWIFVKASTIASLIFG